LAAIIGGVPAISAVGGISIRGRAECRSEAIPGEEECPSVPPTYHLAESLYLVVAQDRLGQSTGEDPI
jgi:hypothetical protein